MDEEDRQGDSPWKTQEKDLGDLCGKFRCYTEGSRLDLGMHVRSGWVERVNVT